MVKKTFVILSIFMVVLAWNPSSGYTEANRIPAQFRGKVIRSRVRYFPYKLLALTFDDGPDPRNTPIVLNALKKYNAHATFFVIGSEAKRYPKLLREIVEGGNEIGSHSYTHPAHPTPAQSIQELDKTAEVIRKATGIAPVCYRPPYGIVHNNLTRLALNRGYAVFLWTISSADTRPVSVMTLANNVIHTPNPGDIILMHDGPGHIRTTQAVPIILSQLTRMGFKFVTLPQLLQAWSAWERTHPHNMLRSMDRSHSYRLR